MKKFFPLIFVFVCVFGVHQSAQAFAGGDGSVESPYQISTCQELQDINNDLTAHYEIINNIDCADTAGWNVNLDEWVDGDTDNPLIPDSYTGVTNNGHQGFEPIGHADYYNSGSGFTGTIDGNDFTISNLWIFRKQYEMIGLFGYATDATISNIRLLNADIVGGSNTGGIIGSGSNVDLANVVNEGGMVRAYLAYRGGGIAGELWNGSTLASAQTIGGTVHGSGNIIGGLVGRLSGSTATNSHSTANIDGGEFVGGAFGQISDSSTVENVYATGVVVSNLSEGEFAKSGRYSGGFAGEITSSTVSDSYATGSVSGEGEGVGGFAGRIDGSTISSSYATGVVSGVSHTGGFVGLTYGTGSYTDTYATGLVSGTYYVGGFAGGAYCNVTFTRAYASGNVTGSNEGVGGFTGADGCEGPGAFYIQVAAHGNVTGGGNNTGGFVGTSYYSDFTDVYASGNVTGTGNSTGGFGGYVYHPKITNAYSRGVVSGGGANVGSFIGTHYIGYEDRFIEDGFYDSETSNVVAVCADGDCSGVTPKTTAEMKTVSTFTDVGWNFDTIWERNSLYNSGYPYFAWETFEAGDVTAPVLTVVTPIASQTSISAAVLTFSSTEACTVYAEAPSASVGSVELIMDPVTGTGTATARLNGMQAGGTYSFRFSCEDANGNASNIIDSGSFTIESATTVVSSGGGRPWVPVTNSPSGSQSSSSSTAPESKPATCPADQILTQNLRAGARDGKYHPYTKAIVKEVKILQGHMNRLGFNSGVVDGILGRITDGAIKRMQTYLGTPADGLVGPKTRALINNSCGDKGLVR